MLVATALVRLLDSLQATFARAKDDNARSKNASNALGRMLDVSGYIQTGTCIHGLH